MGKSVMGYFNTIQLAVCSNERQPWSSIVVEEEHGGDSYTLIWAVGSAGRQGAVAGFLCDNTTHLNFVWKLTTFLFFLLLFFTHNTTMICVNDVNSYVDKNSYTDITRVDIFIYRDY